MTRKVQKETDIVFYIRRYNPEVNAKPYWQEFKVHIEPGMTVLDGLHLIKVNDQKNLQVAF